MPEGSSVPSKRCSIRVKRSQGVPGRDTCCGPSFSCWLQRVEPQMNYSPCIKLAGIRTEPPYPLPNDQMSIMALQELSAFSEQKICTIMDAISADLASVDSRRGDHLLQQPARDSIHSPEAFHTCSSLHRSVFGQIHIPAGQTLGPLWCIKVIHNCSILWWWKTPNQNRHAGQQHSECSLVT